MRLFIVQSHLGGGGAERVGVLLASGFAARGDDVYIVTNLHDAIDYEVDTKVRILNMVSSPQNKVDKWLGAFRHLRSYVKRYNPDVVIGIMQLNSFVSRVACVGTNTHVIMTEHGTFQRPKSAPFSKFNYFCKFYLNKIYECITVITQADKDYIGNRLKNIVVMPNPLLLPQVTKMPSKQRIVLAAGRLDDWHYKGFDVLIKSFAKLLNGSKVAEPRSMFKSNDIAFKIREEGWKLQIAGTGSEKSLNYLKQLCKENGVEDSVEFLGFRKDVDKLYQEASIFVLSSRYEGFGLVLIEAMSQGCACVACDYKGRQREILNPTPTLPEGEGAFEACETGILCEPDDVEALAEAMKKMIEDDEYRESVRINAIERSKYYSIENTMNRWELLLNQIVKG